MAEIFCRTDLLSPASRLPVPRRKAVAIKASSLSFTRKHSNSLRCFNDVKLKMDRRMMANNGFSVKMGLSIGKAMKWWEKGLQSNMKEVASAQDLAESLLSAGERLVVVDFFSPGCGGCKALHPKICQFAERNPDVMFLQVNYEEHKSMCYSLNVHVLPFFRFYRGAHGRVCSFSCTNATIKKFRDALAKHATDRCSLGPVRGLEESELMALAGNKELGFSYTKKPEPGHLPGPVPAVAPTPKYPVPVGARPTQVPHDKALAPSGR